MCRVSVCIATYNGEKFIVSQLRSILGQLSARDEIIISDDGSQDHTSEIIKELNDPKIQFFSNPGKKNVINNFENALKKAKGRYIFLSDQDDIWEPDKLAVMLTYLKQYDVVVSDCSIIDAEDNHIIHDSYFYLRGSGKGLLKNILTNTYMGSCMAFNRFILEKSLPFPEKISMHDWWIGLIGEIFGKTFFCPEKLIRYRRHDNNISPFVDMKKYNLFEKIKFRKNMMIPLFKKWRESKVNEVI